MFYISKFWEVCIMQVNDLEKFIQVFNGNHPLIPFCISQLLLARCIQIILYTIFVLNSIQFHKSLHIKNDNSFRASSSKTEILLIKKLCLSYFYKACFFWRQPSQFPSKNHEKEKHGFWMGNCFWPVFFMGKQIVKHHKNRYTVIRNTNVFHRHSFYKVFVNHRGGIALWNWCF